MKELKTLKDLEFSSDNFMIFKQLRSEAIKWVKASRTTQDICDAFFKFHNITEEDLDGQ